MDKKRAKLQRAARRGFPTKSEKTHVKAKQKLIVACSPKFLCAALNKAIYHSHSVHTHSYFYFLKNDFSFKVVLVNYNRKSKEIFGESLIFVYCDN